MQGARIAPAAARRDPLMDARLSELEIKVADCEDNLAALNKAVFRQQRQIDLLQGQLREIYRMLQAQNGPEAASVSAEPPPHY